MSLEQLNTKCRAAQIVYDTSQNLDTRAKSAIAELAGLAKKDAKDKQLAATITQMERLAKLAGNHLKQRAELNAISKNINGPTPDEAKAAASMAKIIAALSALEGQAMVFETLFKKLTPIQQKSKLAKVYFDYSVDFRRSYDVNEADLNAAPGRPKNAPPPKA